MLIRFVYHFWPEGSGSGNGEACPKRLVQIMVENSLKEKRK